MTARGLAIALLAVAAIGGCRATPTPQAPLPAAKKLDEATNGISTACGLAYQLTAFPGKHEPDLTVLEASAISAADKLTSVYKRNPGWNYQGEPVHAIVTDSLTMLRQCGLSQAAHRLTARTGLR